MTPRGVLLIVRGAELQAQVVEGVIRAERGNYRHPASSTVQAECADKR